MKLPEVYSSGTHRGAWKKKCTEDSMKLKESVKTYPNTDLATGASNLMEEIATKLTVITNTPLNKDQTSSTLNNREDHMTRSAMPNTQEWPAGSAASLWKPIADLLEGNLQDSIDAGGTTRTDYTEQQSSLKTLRETVPAGEESAKQVERIDSLLSKLETLPYR